LLVPPIAVPSQASGGELVEIIPEVGFAARIRITETRQAKLMAIKTTNNVQRFLLITVLL
jgi:hypothetical protein